MIKLKIKNKRIVLLVVGNEKIISDVENVFQCLKIKLLDSYTKLCKPFGISIFGSGYFPKQCSLSFTMSACGLPVLL